ncbi:hypothetical protein IFM89_012583 [Coptis chinensis]|uniref:KIB1-4 beta-propeller domain-containing protein n=1 Tax=Coptis chinensis TaxID=261450 RepID=A0A835H385_9MAGN|nr:hypothetical protein IFM89_012583 [Coptis chinensis]
MQLLHPFSKKVVHLPPFTKLPYAFGTQTDENGVLSYQFGRIMNEHISDWSPNNARDLLLFKAITSSNPDPDSSHSPIVIIINMENSRRSLSYRRPGKDVYWSRVPGFHLNYDDFTFYKGDFYVLDCNGEVGIVKGLDGDGSSPFISPLSLREYDDTLEAGEESLYNLVATSTDLLKVIRDYNDWVDEDSESYGTTKGFRVFKLDFSCTKAPKWVVTKNIGDCALFLGTNNSFSVVPSDFPGCRCNCIYFTSHDVETLDYSGHDKGIFSLDDCMIEGVCPIDCKTICPRPLWYSTNP